MGGKSSSSQATSNYDKRVAVQDGIGISGDGNGVSINTTNTSTTNVMDGGIVSRGLDTVDKTISGALDAVNMSSATNAEGFSSLLKAAEGLWTQGQSLIGQTQKSVADAYIQANTEAKGTIDNKTIIVLAVAGAAALAFASKKG